MKHAITFACTLFIILFLTLTPSTAQFSDLNGDDLKAVRQRTLDFSRLITIDGYLKSGQRNPAWDEDAIAALENLALYQSKAENRKGDEIQQVLERSKAAIAKGCEDPMVMYARAYSGYLLEKELGEHDLIYIKAAWEFTKFDYHPIRKLYAYCRAVGSYDKQGNQKDWTSLIKEEIFNAAMDPAVGSYEKVKVFDFVLEQLYANPKFDDLCREILAGVEREDIEPATKCLLRGAVFHNMAWKARGAGWSKSVSDENGKIFREKNQEAIAEFEKSWELDPNDGGAAAIMVNLMLISDDREKMETWFERAVRLNPFDDDIFLSKLNWLEPKWHGRPQDMFEFGLECVQYGDPIAEIPLVLIDAFNRYSKYGEDKYHKDISPDFFLNQQIYGALRDVYLEHLKRFPQDHFRRSELMKYASWAKDWPLAKEQLEFLGENICTAGFGGRQKMELTVKTVKSAPGIAGKAQ